METVSILVGVHGLIAMFGCIFYILFEESL